MSSKPNMSQNISITRLEYEQAVRKKKPRLVFLLNEDHPWPPKLADSDWQNPTSNIGAFRKEAGLARGVRFFTTPDNLAVAVLEALHALEKKAGGGAAIPPSASIRADYLAWLRRTCESVELLGLDLKDSQNVRLGQVYVPAVTARKADDKRKAELDRERQHELLLHRLGTESLYVPGAPGAGKTTFCRWLALAVACGSLPAHPLETPAEFKERLPNDLRGRFPLLCRLREWAVHDTCLAGNDHWTQEQLEAALAGWLAATRPGGLTPEVWREEMKQGRCLLILDGADEVTETLGPHRPRRNLLSGLTDALPEWLKAGNRVLLTSRPYGLDDADRRNLGLPQAELGELPQPLQETFVRRWYAAADPPHAEEKASSLLVHLGGRPDLAELRANPMLLTALCIKYDEGQRLPQDFYRLYDSVVNQVLYKRYLTENERDQARLRLSAVALGMHQGDDKEPRTAPAAEVGIDEVDCILAKLAQTDWTTEGGSADAASRREDLLSNSGLLLPSAGRRAGFHHLTFQEFLAAVRLRRIGDSAPDLLKQYAAIPAWRRTLTFLFCAIADQDSPESAVKSYETLLRHLEPERLTDDPNPALLLVDCLEVAHGRGWNLMRFADPLRRACEHALEHLKPPERDYLWRALGRLGFDERPGVGLRDGLPDIRWVRIPGTRAVRVSGQFSGFAGLRLGNGAKPDPEAGDDENWPADAAPLEIADFELAAYPVTVAQFRPFVEQGGYREQRYWSADGWRWREGEHQSEPSLWNDPVWTVPNQPVIGVSWYEAEAYCRWLVERAPGHYGVLRLPTEAEWEWAVRGPEGRRYPWGDPWEVRHCNGNEAGLGRTSPVGCFPGGAADWWRVMTGDDGQVQDLAGNVWEWTASAYTEDYSKYNQSVMNADSGGGPRVLRGGSWGEEPLGLRSAARVWFDPRFWDFSVGFRLARTLTI